MKKNFTLQKNKKIINNLIYKQRLDKALSKLFPEYSRSKLKNFILKSYVSVNNTIVTSPKKYVIGGEYIKIQIIKQQNHTSQNIKLNIIYNDHDIIVINKPKNTVVHTEKKNEIGTILNSLLYYYPSISKISRYGIIHRLDKDTSGIMLIAKTEFSQNRLINDMKNKKIYKEYESIVIGNIKNNGSIIEPIKRHKKKQK